MSHVTIVTRRGEEVEITFEEMLTGGRRLYCAASHPTEDGEMVHSGPCESQGYIDVPLEYLNYWAEWLLTSEGGWSIEQHALGEEHEDVHVLLFCCGPCHLAYLARMYINAPPGREADGLEVLRKCGVRPL